MRDMTRAEVEAELRRWTEWEASGFYEEDALGQWRTVASVKAREAEHYEVLKQLVPKLLEGETAPRRGKRGRTAWQRILAQKS